MNDSPQIAHPSLVFTVGRGVLRPLLWLRYRPIVTGVEGVPETGPVLLVSNHLAVLDTVLIPSVSPRKVQFLAKSSLFNGRLKGWFFHQIGAVPVLREAGVPSQAALRTGQRVLAAGQVFAVFPEGSRSHDGRLYRGRSGAAFMALSTNATVIPVGLIGTDRRANPATGKIPRVEVRFGSAVPLDDLKTLPGGQARREATSRIMEAIGALTGQQVETTYSAGGRGA